MIQHKIIVHKPVIQLPAIRQNQYNPPPVNKVLIKTELEYKNYIEQIKFTLGDFVVLDKNPVRSLSMIHIIVDIEFTFNNVQWQTHTGHPKCFKFVQLGMSNCTPWIRWDDPRDYRLPSDEEYETYILPNFDSIQDYCKQHSGYHPSTRPRGPVST